MYDTDKYFVKAVNLAERAEIVPVNDRAARLIDLSRLYLDFAAFSHHLTQSQVEEVDDRWTTPTE